MATVFKAICLEDCTPAPDEDATFTLKRGKEYTISPERDGQVRVFSRYWVWVPATLFAGQKPLGGQEGRIRRRATPP